MCDYVIDAMAILGITAVSHADLMNLRQDASCLDHTFNFQIVVFKVYSNPSSHEESITTFFQKVENTLFQVLRNGFNVPGTPFEAMFAPPQTLTDDDSIEGNTGSLENPIHLPGIKVDHFRSFLRILYPLCVSMILS